MATPDDSRCSAAIPLTGHEAVRCTLPRGHTGAHEWDITDERIREAMDAERERWATEKQRLLAARAEGDDSADGR